MISLNYMTEVIYRVSLAIILFTCVGISAYYRKKADIQTGEKISRKADGFVMMTFIKIGGFLLWSGPVIYLVDPAWMAWSKMGLPAGARWTGIFTGITCTGLVYWLFRNIGSGITATSVTRTKHVLSKSGPYRWIRHPLYTFGTMLFVSSGIISDNWFIIVMGIITFVLMAIRTPAEEANLVEKFGEEYLEYMKTTGRFFPNICRKR